LADRDEIFDYIEVDNLRAAITVDERISAQIERLMQYPEIGRPGRIQRTLELVISRTPYIAAYRTVGDSVLILRILLSWAIGMMIISVILLNGLGAEGLAWLAVFLLSPVSAIYYPVSVLPVWLQWVAWVLPTSHVFEGMRTLLFTGRVDWQQLGLAAGLDAVYLVAGAATFLLAFRAARRQGKLLGLGE
jgi:plasmid stabilization system protein ParE